MRYASGLGLAFVLFFLFFLFRPGLARVEPVKLLKFVAACQFLGNGQIPHGDPFALLAPEGNAGESGSIVSVPNDR